MKREQLFFSILLIIAFIPATGYGQCSACATGAITTLPTTGALNIASGVTYCISQSVNSSASGTVSGTLYIQSGTVTLGPMTLEPSGQIIVGSGATLILGGLYGSLSASVITNLTICSGGFLHVTGDFQEYGLNTVLNSNAVMLVSGSWNGYSLTSFYMDLGAGSMVEVCGGMTIQNNQYFTETSTSTSYVLIWGSISQQASPGWLSNLQASSHINLTIWGSETGLSYNTATTYAGSTESTSLLPPGTSSSTPSCGSASESYVTSFTTLPLDIISFTESPVSGGTLQFNASLSSSLPSGQVLLQSSADGQHFSTVPYSATVKSGNNGDYTFAVPQPSVTTYYRLMVMSGSAAVYSQVLLIGVAGPVNSGAIVYPDPATNFIYLRQPSGNSYQSATVINTAGMVVQPVKLLAPGGTARVELAAGLPTGIYFVRFMGAGLESFTLEVLKAP